MFRHNFTMLSCAVAVGLGLGQAPQVWAQTQVNQAPPQSGNSSPVVVQAPAPTVVNNAPNNAAPSAPVADTAPAARTYPGLKLLGTGAAMFGISYTVTVITAAAISDVCNADSSSLGCRDVKWPIYIPVVGPFIQMGYVSGNGSNTAKALLAIDGVVQGTGLALMIAGAVMTAQERSRPARYSLAPYAGNGTVGLVSMGRF